MRQLRPTLHVRHDEVVAQRHPAAEEDVHFGEGVAGAVITDLTDRGDRVLDPFAGYGTTLRVAEQLGREAVGVELLPERAAICREVAPTATVHAGDARRLRALVPAPFALVLTSPPYMTSRDHPEDPLAAYTGTDGDYGRYLEELEGVFATCLELLTPGGHLVVDVGDIDHAVAGSHHRTPLVADVRGVLEQVGEVVQDVEVHWDRLWQDLVSDHLLVVRPAAGGLVAG